MVESRSDFSFGSDEIARFDESLYSLDAMLADIARRYGLRVIRTSSKGWPGRTIQGRRWLKTYALRVSLNPSYLDTGVIAWDVDDVWMYDYGEFWRRTVRSRQLATHVKLETALATQAVWRIIESALNENLSAQAKAISKL